MAVARVANRVRQGGHFIPETDVRPRFQRGLKNFRELYMDIVDGWFVYDASRPPPKLIAQKTQQLATVFDQVIWQLVNRDAGDDQ